MKLSQGWATAGRRALDSIQRSAPWVLVAVVFSAVLSFPLVISCDGHTYDALAHKIGSAGALDKWDYLRAPLLPLALRACYELFGEHSLGPLLFNALLLLGTAFMLADLVRLLAGPRAGAIALLLIGLSPISMTYSHMLLTETGSAFCLALVIWTLVRMPGRTGDVLTALAIVVAYYFRLSFQFVIPFVALVRVLWRHGLSFKKEAGITLAITLLLPFALVHPWSRLAKESGKMEYTLLGGMVVQALFPEDDPVLGGGAAAYHDAIQAVSTSGSMDVSGMHGEPARQIIPFILANDKDVRSMFRRLLVEHPGRYLAGVWRGSLLFSGWPTYRSDTHYYIDKVFLERENIFDKTGSCSGGEFLTHIIDKFGMVPRQGALARFFLSLIDVYQPVQSLGVIASLLLFVVGAWKRRWDLLALGAWPLSFLAFHVFTLQSLERYGVPTFPLLGANFVIVAFMAGRFAYSLRGFRFARASATAKSA